MRTRATPSKLPSRIYVRHGKRTSTWFHKAADGKNTVITRAPRGDLAKMGEAARFAVQWAKLNTGGAEKSSASDYDKTAPLEVRRIERDAADSALSDLPAWARLLYRRSRVRAAERRISWRLTPSDFARLVAESNGVCAVTGLRFEHSSEKSAGPRGASIDRVASDGDYEIANVRLVCVAVNLAINRWGLEAFLEIADAAIRHRSNSKDPESDSKNHNGLQAEACNPLI